MERTPNTHERQTSGDETVNTARRGVARDIFTLIDGAVENVAVNVGDAVWQGVKSFGNRLRNWTTKSHS